MDNSGFKSTPPQRPRGSGNEQLLAEISAFCQRAGMAESTFGRRVVNDGKLVTRLRFGGRITTHTVDRVRSYIARGLAERSISMPEFARGPVDQSADSALALRPPVQEVGEGEPSTHFRFYDNRQKYLLFVHTCNE